MRFDCNQISPVRDKSVAELSRAYTIISPFVTSPPHTILPQDALHRPFLCSFRSVFRWVILPKYMLTSFLTFLAAVAYAAPAAPQRAMSKRQQCQMYNCKFEVSMN